MSTPFPRGKKRRSFTLEGPAAGAYSDAQAGKPATTLDEQALRVAAFVHLKMQSDPAFAVELIKRVAIDGIKRVASSLTSARASE